jgi:hypothetical protein
MVSETSRAGQGKAGACHGNANTFFITVIVYFSPLVYLRVSNGKPGFGATVTTFATSALWHGFHPGYYCKSSFE